MAARGPERWFFDLWSRVYDLPWVQRATYRPVHDAVLRALRHARGRRLLDVGCGTGQLACRIQEARRGDQVVGFDFSHGMLCHAAARRRDVRWIQGDAACLPFRNCAFDVITSTEAFHWFPDQDAALAEFFRVLAPGGRLLLALVNTPTGLVSEVLHVASRLGGQPFYWPTSAQMRRRLEAAGFHVERQRRIFRFPGVLLPPVLTSATRPSSRSR